MTEMILTMSSEKSECEVAPSNTLIHQVPPQKLLLLLLGLRIHQKQGRGFIPKRYYIILYNTYKVIYNMKYIL